LFDAYNNFDEGAAMMMVLVGCHGDCFDEEPLMVVVMIVVTTNLMMVIF
jgi:hypothetical protein